MFDWERSNWLVKTSSTLSKKTTSLIIDKVNKLINVILSMLIENIKNIFNYFSKDDETNIITQKIPQCAKHYITNKPTIETKYTMKIRLLLKVLL